MGDSPQDQVNAAVSSVTENLNNLPGAQSAPSAGRSDRIFNRGGKSVHGLLGAGKSADVLLWRHVPTTAGVLIVVTIAYVLLQWSGWTVLSLISNLLILAVVVAFVWSNAAALLNKSPPPLPELQLSEGTVIEAASAFRIEVNKILELVHDVALGRDFTLFLKVVALLWVVSKIGGWTSFLTLSYIIFIVLHTFPFLYEKYEEEINKYAKVAADHAQVQYAKVNEQVLKKIPRSGQKEKKAE